ncbi:uncharacterized protein LOC133336051 [Musca vetustissima]|uniref:uncharacterized protein LOC133336051 n=1 Tax=Musca vetustissima TaxID=27455 RepID=UPI002AB7055B|nr:uncharacterized protein LOC133336051 [Musca vetustissima]
MEENYVIFDCDIGNDDAWALIMLIKAEKLLKDLALKGRRVNGAVKPFKILGVTCVRGNTDVDNGVENALRVLDAVDRLDIPVYRGCDHSIIPPNFEHKHFHGLDGFGDVTNLPYVTKVQARTEHAVNMMYSSVCKKEKIFHNRLVRPFRKIYVS